MFAANRTGLHRALAAAVACLTLEAFGTPAATAQERGCHVSGQEGSGAELWHGGSWAPLASAPLPAGASKIVTDAESRVEITCSDGVTLTIAPDTEVNLEELTAIATRQDNVVLQLIEGIVGLVAPERSFRVFEVRTPLAIASVRSTEWAVAHEGGESATFVRAGEVVVRAGGQRRVLRSGDGVDVSADGRAGPVRRWGAPRVARLNEALGFAWR